MNLMGVHRADSFTRSLSHIGFPQVLKEHDGFLLTLAKDPSSMNQLIRNRERSFHAQGGRCYYCRCAMWHGDELGAFRQRYSLTKRQARKLQCTAEHITARCDGGTDVMGNIAAACLRCNTGRHSRKKPPQSSAFVAYVVRRVSRRKWHDFDVWHHGLLDA